MADRAGWTNGGLFAPTSVDDLVTGGGGTGPRNQVRDLLIARLRERSTPTKRSDGARLALVIEGGAMRGAVSIGMLAFLEQIDAVDAFDDIVGSSAGAINGAFFLARQARMAATVYYNEMLSRRFISFRRVFTTEPMVSLEYLLDEVIADSRQLDAEAVLRSKTHLHPIATSVSRMCSVDLRPFVTSPVALREALRATARVQMFAGDPVPLGDDRYFDATLVESIPIRTARKLGCTHVVVLRTRPAGKFRSPPSRVERLLVERHLAKLGPRLVELYRNRAAEYRAEVAVYEDGLAGSTPAVFQIAPSDGRVPSNYARSRPKVLEGARGGMRAAAAALTGREPETLEILMAFFP